MVSILSSLFGKFSQIELLKKVSKSGAPKWLLVISSPCSIICVNINLIRETILESLVNLSLYKLDIFEERPPLINFKTLNVGHIEDFM